MTDPAAHLLAFGRAVQAHREAHHLTQDDVAARAGVSANTIYRLEAGYDLRVSTLIRVTEALGLALPESPAGV